MKKIIFSIAILISVSAILNGQSIQYPITKTVEQTDNYFGTQINDPYRWLENDASEATKAWVKEENNVTHEYFS